MAELRVDSSLTGAAPFSSLAFKRFFRNSADKLVGMRLVTK